MKGDNVKKTSFVLVYPQRYLNMTFENASQCKNYAFFRCHGYMAIPNVNICNLRVQICYKDC